MKLSSGKFVVSMMILALITIMPVSGADDFEIIKLSGNMYPDGSAKIEYELELDPVAARVNVSLLGSVFDDLTVIDDDGLLLDHTTNDGVITIDSLGSYRVNVSYFTPSLTNKTGSLWTLSVDSPSRMYLKLPIGATIVGLNPVPEGISISNNQASITMSDGSFSVTYVVSITGIQNEAQEQIEVAQDAVNDATSSGVVTTDGESLLEKALTSFTLGNYIEAKTYAVQAKAKVDETTALAGIASSEINEAETKLEGINTNPEVYNTANDLLQSARDSYEEGNYTQAYSQAQQAGVAADKYEPPNNQALYALLVLGVLVAGYLVWKYLPRGKESTKSVERYDVEAILEENTHLRSDEREIIQFISQHNEGLFITVVRDRFNIPKSTAWRMMQRFEEADIIETKSIGRETFVKINSIWAFEE